MATQTIERERARRDCDWCGRSRVWMYGREAICGPCSPYAWAALLHPERRAENMQIALERAYNA